LFLFLFQFLQGSFLVFKMRYDEKTKMLCLFCFAFERLSWSIVALVSDAVCCSLFVYYLAEDLHAV